MQKGRGESYCCECMVIGKDIRYNTTEEAVIMNEKMFI